MLRIAAITLAAALLLPAIAQAGCQRSVHDAGYVFVWASCTAVARQSPANVCQRTQDTPSHNVAFVSNVIRDDGRNRRYPASGFFNAVQNQHSITMNGNVSACFASEAEAQDELDRLLAQLSRDDYRILRVRMRDH